MIELLKKLWRWLWQDQPEHVSQEWIRSKRGEPKGYEGVSWKWPITK